jgi:hypothetical protein
VQSSKAWRCSRLLHRLRGAVRGLIADDYGMALIVAVVMLVALTVIGIAALTMTNVGLKMAAGEKAFNVALYNGDAGASVTAEVLEEAILLRGLPNRQPFKNSGIFVNDGGFWNEDMVFDPASVASAGLTRTYVTWPYDYYDDQNTHRPIYAQAAHNHDEDVDDSDPTRAYDLGVNMTLGGGATVRARVDIDYLQMEEAPGSSTLAGMGYDGRARGVAGGGAKRVYGFAVRGDGPGSTTSKVRAAVTYDHVL